MLDGGTLLSGRCEILKTIGAGGYGTVYRGRDRWRDRVVAVKVRREDLSEGTDDVRRFQRGSRVASMLDSGHLVRVLETNQDMVNCRVARSRVMELVDGMTLHEAVQSSPLTADEALRVAAQLARALEEVEQGSLAQPLNLRGRRPSWRDQGRND